MLLRSRVIKNQEERGDRMNKKIALMEMEAKIKAEYGEGAICKLSDLPAVKDSFIPTGFNELDKALGIGGIPRGKVIEVFGDSMCGKTTLALSISRQVQKMGGNILYVDADCGLSPYMLRSQGVTDRNFYTVNAETMEDAFEICVNAIQGFSLIVIDSITALRTRADGRNKLGDYYGGRPQASLVNQFISVITKFLQRNDCTLLILNQVRIKQGVLFGNPEQATCGRALKYYASVRIEALRYALPKGDNTTTFRFKVAKNKYAAPIRSACQSVTYAAVPM